MKSSAPVFVKINDYREVLDILNVINEKVSEAKVLVSKINQIKKKEDRELETWESGLLGVEEKLREIDVNLSEVNTI